MNWRRDGYEISTDPTRLDHDAIWGFLRTSDWSPGIARDVVERAIQNSIPLHPDLAGLRVLLDTDNAQGLYSRFGFRAVDASQVMERLGLT